MEWHDKIYVIGHRNPDMDTVAAAIGYSWLLNNRDGLNSIPARAGELNSQTVFVLRRFKVEAPELLTDAWIKVGQLCQRIGPLSPDQTLLEAARAVAAIRRPVPVVGKDGKPLGIITGSGLFAALNDLLAGPITSRLEQRLTSPCISATDRDVPIFHADERVRDVRPLAVRGIHDDFPVIDEGGCYIGMVEKTDLLAPRPMKLVMVDHNEIGQALPGLEEAEIISVLDHHRLGNPPTPAPIRFKVDPVGSCSTLVFEEAMDANLIPPPDICGVLLGGILSDTLVLRSPTTTSRDRTAALKLTSFAGLVEMDASPSSQEEALFSFGSQILTASSGLGQRPAEQVISADLKTYQQDGIEFAIAQVEVPGFAELDERLTDLQIALDHLREQKGLSFTMLLVTDIVRATSRVMVSGPARLFDGLPYQRRPDGTLEAVGVVSRKKQLLPAVTAALEAR